MLFSFAGWFVAQFITLLVAIPFFGTDQMALVQAMAQPDDSHRVPLLLMQAASSFCLFIFTPWVYLRFMEERAESLLGIPNVQPLMQLLGLTALIMLVYLPISGLLVQFNEQVVFPESLRSLESVFRAMEDPLTTLTNFLVKFNSFGEFLLGLLVIGVLAGIGEEFLFRGVLQNRIKEVSGNIHVAIWVTAFLFSAIHFQFYGLLPRMALGALFGYLYYWSGSLVYPMLAHFLNNGVTLTMLYLFHLKKIPINIEEDKNFPLEAALVSAALVTFLLVIFKRKTQPQNFSAPNS